MIQDYADKSDPVRSPDPIAFVSVFSVVLVCLVPRDVVRTRDGEIYEVMGELAGIFVEEDGLSLPKSRKKCVECAQRYFSSVDIDDRELVPKLRELIGTWSLQWLGRRQLSVPYP